MAQMMRFVVAVVVEESKIHSCLQFEIGVFLKGLVALFWRVFFQGDYLVYLLAAYPVDLQCLDMGEDPLDQFYPHREMPAFEPENILLLFTVNL
jgi:hypothetical protein